MKITNRTLLLATIAVLSVCILIVGGVAIHSYTSISSDEEGKIELGPAQKAEVHIEIIAPEEQTPGSEENTNAEE